MNDKTHLIYSMTSSRLQEQYAGHQSALECAYFTDNPIQAGFDDACADGFLAGTVGRCKNGNGLNGTGPLIVRVEAGIFTGAYTFDEQDE